MDIDSQALTAKPPPTAKANQTPRYIAATFSSADRGMSPFSRALRSFWSDASKGLSSFSSLMAPPAAHGMIAAGDPMKITGRAGMTRLMTPDSAWNMKPPRVKGAASSIAIQKLRATSRIASAARPSASGQPPGGQIARLSAISCTKRIGRPRAISTASPARWTRLPMGWGAASFWPPTSCDSDAVAAMAEVAMSSDSASSRNPIPAASPISVSPAAWPRVDRVSAGGRAGGTSPASIGVTARAAAARTRTGTTRSPSPGRTRTKAWTRR